MNFAPFSDKNNSPAGCALWKYFSAAHSDVFPVGKVMYFLVEM